MKRLTLPSLALLLVGGCVVTKGDPPVNRGLAYFSVEFIGEPDLGSEIKALPMQAEYSFTVDITARGWNKQHLEDYEGEIDIRMLGADIATVRRVPLTDGVAEDVDVTILYGAGREAITVHEVETWAAPDGTVGTRDTGKLGLSESVYLPLATIPMIQGIHDGDERQGFISRYNNRNLNLTGQEFIVLAVIEGGFYMKDPSADAYSSIYLYTYSTPYVDDVSANSTSTYHALQPGSIIEEVNGSLFEFFGFTEMSFPTYKPKRAPNGAVLVEPDRIPPPRDISEFLDLGQLEEVEKYESSLVSVTDVTVADFDPNDFSFIEYFQFPLQREESGAYLMAVTISTAPTFSPIESRGKKISRITGILKQHRTARPSTYILVPRSLDDIEIAE